VKGYCWLIMLINCLNMERMPASLYLLANDHCQIACVRSSGDSLQHMDKAVQLSKE